MKRVNIIGVIGQDVRAADLLPLPAGPLQVMIASPGGSVLEGMAIYEALRARSADLEILVQYACSIASVIAMAGRRLISGSGTMMIHAATALPGSGLTPENLAAMQRQMEAAYVAGTGQSPATVRRWLAGQTWFSPAEAVAAGLAAGQVDGLPMPAAALADVKTMVARLFPENTEPKPKDTGTMLELLKKLAKLFGLPVDAIAVDATGQIKAEAVAQLEAKADAQLAALTAQADAQAKADRKAIVDQALKEGRFSQAMLGAVANLDNAQLAALAASIPANAVVPMAQQVDAAAAAADKVELNPAQHVKICRMFGNDPEKVRAN